MNPAAPGLAAAAEPEAAAGPGAATGAAQPRPELAIEGRASSSLGLLPGLAWGFGGAASLRWRGLGLSVFGQRWLPRTAWVEGAPGKGGEFWAWGAGAQASVAVLRRPLLVELSAGGEGSRLHAEGRGVDETEAVRIDLFSVVAGGSVSVPLGARAFASAGIRGAAPLSGRRRFVLDEIGTVYRPNPLNARVFLGLGWSF